MDTVKNSDGVNHSDGVSYSDGVNWSGGVNYSGGVNHSNGVNWSYGILNSFGVDHALFLADKKRTWSIFGKEVTEERFNEVWDELFEELNGWFPKFNTAHLWLKKMGSWEKVDASKIEETLDDWEKPYEAWKDMPQGAIEYVASLPEFDAVMFERITGINVKSHNSKKELLDMADELIAKAQELKEQAERID